MNASKHKCFPERSFSLRIAIGLIAVLSACSVAAPPSHAQDQCVIDHSGVPDAIKTVFDKPIYNGGIWGLRVDDLDSGKTLIALQPDCALFIGSVRKIFSIGELLNQIGPTHRYNTPVIALGDLGEDGVLHGDLILVASGDLTMGGRTNPDGSVAYTSFDHNEADSLGNAILSTPDPLAGYKALAQQVAQNGIVAVTGDVIIDDRLFQPFNFREQFDVRPIFVNDDAVDASIEPTRIGKRAQVAIRPLSEALTIKNRLRMGAAGSDNTLKLNPELPQCIGQRRCSAAIEGDLPIDFVPPLTMQYPLVQTFRIVEPSNYARTVFIEALKAEGVTIHASPVAPNRIDRLSQHKGHARSKQVAELVGLPYSEDAKLILKVSYNIGADTSLVLFGLTQGVNNLNDALDVEKKALLSQYGIPDSEFYFIDGSGGGDTTAKSAAIIKMLVEMRNRPAFPSFFDALPILAVDGSLAFTKGFQSDPTLAGATGQVHAKTGTYVAGTETSIVLKGQAFAGYITTKTGRHLVYEVIVNNLPISGLDSVLDVFQDEATVSAILWRDF